MLRYIFYSLITLQKNKVPEAVLYLVLNPAPGTWASSQDGFLQGIETASNPQHSPSSLSSHVSDKFLICLAWIQAQLLSYILVAGTHHSIFMN